MVQVRARSQVGFGWVDSQKTQVWLWVNPFLLRVKKIEFGSSISILLGPVYRTH